MAKQEEPLYDFPEPTQPSERKFSGHQRAQGSLRSVSILDRLLLTVPVWLQLSINPATALHILQREPPATFLVRKSRTSQRNVLCVRLADDSVPFFVQQFGIREEQSTLSLETSAISFPDLPRLISFYCVSRDVLPFSLELPEAIAKATSHKELESISHMGVEFWSSHLNFRGPREAPKPQKGEEKKSDAINSAPQTGSAMPPDAATQSDSDRLLQTAPQPDGASEQPGYNPTVFREFCPIATRSPLELDCGSGQGALCFVNPLFLQSQNILCRQRMFKRSFKVRVSTETSTLLSPPLLPPPPPPVMPKTKGRCKAQKQQQAKVPNQATEMAPVVGDSQPLMQTDHTPSEARVQPPSPAPHLQEQSQTRTQPDQRQEGPGADEAPARLAAALERLPDASDYMQPSPMINISLPSFTPTYNSPSLSPMMCNLVPKVSPTLSPLGSPGASPMLSPYQSPSVSPKVPCSFSPYGSPSASPYQSPSPSPKVLFALSPFHSPVLSELMEQAYHTPAALPRPDQERSGPEAEEEGGNEEDEACEEGLVLQMKAATIVQTSSRTNI